MGTEIAAVRYFPLAALDTGQKTHPWVRQWAG